MGKTVVHKEKQYLRQEGTKYSGTGHNTWYSMSVTFPVPYTEVPIVSLNNITETSNENYCLTSVSKTGFQFQGYCNNTSWNFGYIWQAFGPIN